MMRFVVRVLGPLRRAVRSRIDARYVTKVDHRQDIKDTLWEVQMLRREVVALRGEVDRLRQPARTSSAPAKAGADSRVAEAHRLASETAEALDRVLQNEMRIWQAIDDLSAKMTATGREGYVPAGGHPGQPG